MDYTDRGTCILFGDGAGAAVAVASADKLTADWGASGDREVLSAGQLLPDGQPDAAGDERQGGIPVRCEHGAEEHHPAAGKGRCTAFGRGSHRLPSGKPPHCGGIAKHLHTDLSRFYENIEFYGNTSAASIPIALCDMQEQELLHRGERMVLAGFGSGLTWGSVLMNW